VTLNEIKLIERKLFVFFMVGVIRFQHSKRKPKKAI